MPNSILKTAATGMRAQETRTEVIASNIANVSTTGFKSSRAGFQDLMYQTIQDARAINTPDAGTLPSIQVGRGVELAGVRRIQTQGGIEQTGRPLDLAIEGDGFFRVQLPNGDLAYTRDGSFDISDQGMLVTSQGYTVAPGIRIPSDVANVSISRAGVVTATRGTSTVPVELGRIELARFVNPAGLSAQGENLYVETPSSGQPVVGYPQEDGAGRLLQNALEGSNVEIVQEMTDMIAAQRAYELSSKSIKTGDEMMQTANNLIR